MNLTFKRKQLNSFRYDIIPAKENTNGIKVNGTWTGLIGQIVRGVWFILDRTDYAIIF